MAVGALLTEISDYLQEQQATGSGPARRGGRADPQAAARALQGQVQAYLERRAVTVKSILVAVDDSEPAEWALDEAMRLASGLDALVSLVHVIDVAPVLAPELAFEDAIKRPALLDEGRALLRGLAQRVPTDLLGEQILREGDAAKQIIAAAQKLRIDLLAIGTHGRGLLGRFLLGSVAEAVVRHATVPVLTVGHPRQGVPPALCAGNIGDQTAGTDWRLAPYHGKREVSHDCDE